MNVTTPDTIEIAAPVEISDDLIDRYLQSLGCTIWGEAIDISTPKGRQRAIDKIWKVFDGLERLAAEDYS